MSSNKAQKNADKEFGMSSWAIDSKTTIWVMIAIFLALGVSAYFTLPRESFPEIEETKVYIRRAYVYFGFFNFWKTFSRKRKVC